MLTTYHSLITKAKLQVGAETAPGPNAQAEYSYIVACRGACVSVCAALACYG